MEKEISEAASGRRRSVAAAAKAAGLLAGESRTLGARVPTQLVSRAKERSGIASTTDLVEYALAKVALEDDFGVNLASRKGLIPVDIALGL